MNLTMTVIIFLTLCGYFLVAFYMLRQDEAMRVVGLIMIVMFLWLIAGRVADDITHHQPVIGSTMPK